MAPIPPSRRRGFQFRAEEIDDFLEVVETYLPISAQNWQTVADSHLENYPREQQTAESLRRKFQEISRRTGPTGDPTCPPYVKAKAINRQLVQMIDASSGGSEAKRSGDGLSDAYDSEDKGAGEEFAAAGNGNRNGGGRRLMRTRRTPMMQGLVFRDWCGFVWNQPADEGQPGAADDGVVGAVAGVAPPDGVAPAVARPRGRGPGRSRYVPAGGAAGVVGPPPAAGVVGAPPAAGVVGAPPAAGVVGARPAAGVVGARPLAQRAPRATVALRVCAVEAPRGRAFTTPINRRRKRHADSNDDEGGMSASNIMGMMMMQQRSKQSSRDANRTAREAELALCREEITMQRKEMATQMAMQQEETRAHQQMMNVMLMAMMRNAGGSNHQKQRMDIGGSNQQQRKNNETNEQQNNGNNE